MGALIGYLLALLFKYIIRKIQYYIFKYKNTNIKSFIKETWNGMEWTQPYTEKLLS